MLFWCLFLYIWIGDGFVDFGKLRLMGLLKLLWGKMEKFVIDDVIIDIVNDDEIECYVLFGCDKENIVIWIFMNYNNEILILLEGFFLVICF